MTITLADYLLYCDEPMHFWAKCSGKKAVVIADGMAEHRGDADGEARELAKKYLQTIQKKQYGHWNDLFNQTIALKGCTATIDGLFYDKATDSYDAFFLYMGTDAANYKHQVTFKKIVAEYRNTIRRCYVIHLNSAYRRDGKIEPEMLFRVTLADNYVSELQSDAREAIAAAIAIEQGAQKWFDKLTNDEMLPCGKPSECMYPDVCHPYLDDHKNRNPSPATIYDIPRISTQHRRELRAAGVIELSMLTDDEGLSEIQKRHIEVMRSRKPSIDLRAIAEFCGSVSYPLTFLDYEAVQFPVPLDGYQPYNSVPFQFSLHIIDEAGKEPRHIEYLCTDKNDDAEDLIKALLNKIPDRGSILTWNSSYEKGVHKTLAGAFPRYADALNALNNRVIDLAKCFSGLDYMHPAFKGKWSIKAVLPVIRGNDPYGKFKQAQHVSNGAEAVGAWWRIAGGKAGILQRGGIRNQLLAYCKQDTQSMVDIWLHLVNLVKQR